MMYILYIIQMSFTLFCIEKGRVEISFLIDDDIKKWRFLNRPGCLLGSSGKNARMSPLFQEQIWTDTDVHAMPCTFT